MCSRLPSSAREVTHSSSRIRPYSAAFRSPISTRRSDASARSPLPAPRLAPSHTYLKVGVERGEREHLHVARVAGDGHCRMEAPQPGHIAATSRPRLGHIMATSRLHVGYILALAISAASPRHLGGVSASAPSRFRSLAPLPRRVKGQGIDGSPLASRVSGTEWSWAGIPGLAFRPGGELITPWGQAGVRSRKRKAAGRVSS